MALYAMNLPVFARAAAISILAALSACSSEEGTTVEGDVALAYVRRPNTIGMNPTDAFANGIGGDLFIRERASPSAPEHNITASITQGTGDVSDPEVSYDGKKIVFALRCTNNTATINSAQACTSTWDIWEYDMTGATGLNNGTLRRITGNSAPTSTCDEVDPAYLAANVGYVFSSNCTRNTAVGQTYTALDEYERERVINLHTVDANGGNLKRISVNQSHDRNPTLLSNGRIMFSRWDHVGGRNHFSIFQTKPDGTDMFVLYGAHSPGNSFLHPREMQPGGAYNGHVATSLMPLSRTHEGGALMFIDIANYSEHNTPANSSVPSNGGQSQATTEALNTGRGISLGGRVSTPYPLWDGTNRVLVSWTPCQLTYNGVVTACANVPQNLRDQLSNENLLNSDPVLQQVQDNVPPAYGIYMFDPSNQTMRVVVGAQAGWIYTDPVAIQARTEPNPIAPTQKDGALELAGMGILEVRSVYDTDDLGRMGNGMLASGEGPIPTVSPASIGHPDDTRAQVPDIAAIKNPVNNAYRNRPARFMRFVRAVPPPSGSTGLRAAIGETDFEMKQILGYAEIEPDGSFKVKVPADTPIEITALDAQGRAFQAHTNWIQVRPGETRTCDGCHSPRRGAALNSGTVTGNHPNTLLTAQAGETMAGTRTRINPSVMDLKPNIEFSDVWSNMEVGGVTQMPNISIRYTGNTPTSDDLTTAAPATSGTLAGIINYPDHIQPLWTKDRGANTCTNCHANAVNLDLRANISGTGRLISYQELMLGDPLFSNGLPVTEIRDGEIVQVLGPALVDVGASQGEATGLARKSRLVEILFGQTLLAGTAARTAHPNPPNDHSAMLNKAEKRLLTEWIDLGGQYYNNPFTTGANVRTVTGLSEQTFETTIHPILRATCAASCHQAQGTDPTIVGATSFTNNRYVLTGSVEGDYNATLSMVNNACQPQNSYLLSRPSTIPHPSTAQNQATAVLPAGSADFNTISAWILTGCN